MAFTHNNGLTSSPPPSSTAEPDDISLLLSHLLHRPLQPPLIPSSSPSALQPHSGIGMVNQHPVFISCTNNSSSNHTSTIFHHNSNPCPPSAIFSGSDRLVVDRISNAEPFGGDTIGFSNPGYFFPFAGGGSGAYSTGKMESESLTGSGDFGGQFRSFENETEDYDCDSEEGAEAAMEELQPDQQQQQQQPQRSSSKRSRAAQVHNLSEKRRRSRINEKMKALQNLIPNSNKTDKASMLDEAIEYLKQLQLQVQMLSMRNGLSLHPMCLPGTMPGLLPIQLSQMGMDADNNACGDNNTNNTTLPTTMSIRTRSNNNTFPMNNTEEPSAVVDPNAMFNLLSITNPYAPLPSRPHTLNNTESLSFGPGSSSTYHQGAHHLGPAPFDHLTSSYQETSGRKDSCLPNRQLVAATRTESDTSVEGMMQPPPPPHHTNNVTDVGKERSSSQHRDMFTRQETLSMTLAMLRQNHERNEFLPGATLDGL